MPAHKYAGVPTLDSGQSQISASPRSDEGVRPPRHRTSFAASHLSVALSEHPPGEEMLHKYFPAGKYGQYVAAIIATTSLFVSAQVCSWPNGAFPKIFDGSAGFTLTDLEKSLMASLPNIAGVLAPLPCSYVIDKLGRKTTLTCSLGFVIVSWLIIAFTKNVPLILFCRLMMGFWNGTEYITVSIYIAEVVDASVRGSLISVTGMMFYLGALFISLISFTSYQTMTLLCVISPALLLIGFLFIPESPYFFLMHGRREEAEAAIVWLKGECHPKHLDKLEEAVKEQLEKQASFKEIFNKSSNRKGFFLVECFKIGSACSATVLLYPFSTVVFPQGWFSPQQSHIILCFVWVASAMVSSALMYRFKRRSLMVISTLGTILMLLFTATWYFLRDCTNVDTSTTSYLPLLLLSVTVFFETIGIINIPNIVKGEIFPMNIKTKACALSCMTAGFFETINYMLFFHINNQIGMYFNFVKSATIAGLSLIIVIFVMIETKGQTLEMIQELLNSKKPPKGSPAVVEILEEVTELEKIPEVLENHAVGNREG